MSEAANFQRIGAISNAHTGSDFEQLVRSILTGWNVAPIFFVLKDVRGGESFAEYYVRRYGHMVPDGVKIWEYCASEGATVRKFTGR